jgi:hypothetical protein
VTSFFFNIGAVATDVRALIRAKRMPAPGAAAADRPARPDVAA